MTSTAPASRPHLVAPKSQVSNVPKIYKLLEHPDTIKKLKAMATTYLTPERALGLMIRSIRNAPALAECDPYSVFGAMMTAHALGLEANTVLGHAYLIPFKKSVPRKDERGKILKDDRGSWITDDTYECQFQIGYKGYVALASRQDEILTLTAEAIRDGDQYESQKGTDTFLRYSKSLTGERGEIIGAFCFTHLQGGQAFSELTSDDLFKIRARSETYKALSLKVEKAENDKDRKKAEAKLAETPWVLWADAMCAKSAIKAHCKQLDLSPEIAVASEIDSAADAGKLNMANLSDPDFLRDVIDGGNIPRIEEGDDEPIDTLDHDAETGEVKEPVGDKQSNAPKQQPKQRDEPKGGGRMDIRPANTEADGRPVPPPQDEPFGDE